MSERETEGRAGEAQGEEVEVAEVDGEIGWTETLEAQFGSAPWWLVSAVFHMFVLALLGLIVIVEPTDGPHEVIHAIPTPPPVDEPEPPMKPQQFARPDGVWHDEEVNAEETLIFKEEAFEVSEEIEYENNCDDSGALGEPENISDMPMAGKGVLGNLGVDGNPGGPFGDFWGGRKDRRLRASRWGPKRGPTEGSERALNRALEWLRRHQEADGRWDGETHEGEDTDVALTGLAVLAFQGEGHSERHGKYAPCVRAGVAWLIKEQEADGCIGRGYKGGLGYHHAIAGLALAEAFGMGKVTRTGVAARKAAEYSVKRHQGDYTAWRYTPKQEPDMSVSGWFIMQLKSACVANVWTDTSWQQGACAFLDKCTKHGEHYAGQVSYKPERSATATMTAVGAVSRLFMGWKANDPLVIGAAQHILENLPRWEGERDGVNFYYWYYGALAMFQVGGDYWKAWNVAMRDMLVEHQRRGGPDIDGSWDPVGQWCGRGGRVFSTAVGALCLEIYSRYPIMLQE